jgi:hypothetical protein
LTFEKDEAYGDLILCRIYGTCSRKPTDLSVG